jgi:hypothetical protein
MDIVTVATGAAPGMVAIAIVRRKVGETAIGIVTAAPMDVTVTATRMAATVTRTVDAIAIVNTDEAVVATASKAAIAMRPRLHEIRHVTRRASNSRATRSGTPNGRHSAIVSVNASASSRPPPRRTLFPLLWLLPATPLRRCQATLSPLSMRATVRHRTVVRVATAVPVGDAGADAVAVAATATAEHRATTWVANHRKAPISPVRAKLQPKSASSMRK